MELANQGMFFDDEEVNKWEILGLGVGGGGVGVREPGSLSLFTDRDAAPQVRKHKAANDKCDGLCVGSAKSEPKPIFFLLVIPGCICLLVTSSSGTRRCWNERGALRSLRWKAAGQGYCGA